MFGHKGAGLREMQARERSGRWIVNVPFQARMRKEMYFAVASTLRCPQ
jgi:hypothetical protein